jgi:hypothetical protein
MAEVHIERVHTEMAVLDIGDNVGALMLRTGSEFCGREIEISPKQDPARRVHTQIHERLVNGSTSYSGVFPELKEGEYFVWGDGPEPIGGVTIAGGEVATLDWTGE